MKGGSANAPTGDGTLRRLLWRLDTPLGLSSMLAVSLLLQLLVAPYTGVTGDHQFFISWTTRLADVGAHDFYVNGRATDYPPGYLYVLWLTSKFTATPSYLVLKLPCILSDLGLAWVAGVFATRLAPASLLARWPVRALVIAGVLFNPAVLAVGPIWGQVDSVPALLRAELAVPALHREAGTSVRAAQRYCSSPSRSRRSLSRDSPSR